MRQKDQTGAAYCEDKFSQPQTIPFRPRSSKLAPMKLREDTTQQTTSPPQKRMSAPYTTPISGTFLASAGVPTEARHNTTRLAQSCLPPSVAIVSDQRGHTRTRRIRTDGRMHVRPAQLHCGRGKPGLRREVGHAPRCVVRRPRATRTRIGTA